MVVVPELPKRQVDIVVEVLIQCFTDSASIDISLAKSEAHIVARKAQKLLCDWFNDVVRDDIVRGLNLQCLRVVQNVGC